MVENNQETPSNQTNDPVEGLNDSLNETMPLSYRDSPGMLVIVSDNPMLTVSESKHGVLKMIQAKLECFEEYSSTLAFRMIHGNYAARWWHWTDLVGSVSTSGKSYSRSGASLPCESNHWCVIGLQVADSLAGDTYDFTK